METQSRWRRPKAPCGKSDTWACRGRTPEAIRGHLSCLPGPVRTTLLPATGKMAHLKLSLRAPPPRGVVVELGPDRRVIRQELLHTGRRRHQGRAFLPLRDELGVGE